SRIEDVSGRFPQVSGLKVTYDPKAEPGSRVVEAMVGDSAVDPAATYKLATNDFMANGGDGYAMFKGAPRIIDAVGGKLMAAQVMEYIEAAGTVSPTVEGRIVGR
ncbi:MAG: 5'-nucleotidase C-terminal domain-containing protein, partial [Alphaproteobacteria bacterium]